MSVKRTALVIPLGLLMAWPMLADPPADPVNVLTYKQLDETIDANLEEELPSMKQGHVAPLRPRSAVLPKRVAPTGDPTDDRADPNGYQKRADVGNLHDWRFHMRQREGHRSTGLSEVETHVDYNLDGSQKDIVLDRNRVKRVTRTVQRRMTDNAFLDRRQDRYKEDRAVDGRVARRVDGRKDRRVEHTFDRRVDKETRDHVMRQVPDLMVTADLRKRDGMVRVQWPSVLTDVDVLLSGKSGTRLLTHKDAAWVADSGQAVLIPVRYRARSGGKIRVKFTGVFDTLLVTDVWDISVHKHRRADKDNSVTFAVPEVQVEHVATHVVDTTFVGPPESSNEG
ncbi:MAG: hypothetical protein ACI9WU_002321 [Myxococcota bacterium]|jgi:hypothetical protein